VVVPLIPQMNPRSGPASRVSNKGPPGGRRGGITGAGFTPGVSGNPGGRPRHLARWVCELVGDDGEAIACYMVAVMSDETERTADRMEAARWLADRGFGRPTQTLDVDVRAREKPWIDLTKLSALIALVERALRPRSACPGTRGDITAPATHLTRAPRSAGVIPGAAGFCTSKTATRSSEPSTNASATPRHRRRGPRQLVLPVVLCGSWGLQIHAGGLVFVDEPVEEGARDLD
jgi:hypothetical protein